MEVKAVLALASTLLGREDLCEALENDEYTSQQEKEISRLLKCYNLIESEVAVDFIPLTVTQNFLTLTGEIEYSTFSKTPCRIVKVKRDEERINYRIFPNRIKTGIGNISVTYCYIPESKTLSDSGEYEYFVTDRLIAYGICSEYCLFCGDYNEANMWNAKYKDALLIAAHSVRGDRRVKDRVWA